MIAPVPFGCFVYVGTSGSRWTNRESDDSTSEKRHTQYNRQTRVPRFLFRVHYESNNVRYGLEEERINERRDVVDKCLCLSKR